MSRTLIFVGSILLFWCSALSAQEGFTFIAGDAVVSYDPILGEAEFTTTISIIEDEDNTDYPNETAGFQMGLSHDGDVLTILDAVVSGELDDIRDGDGPGFFAPDLEPDGGSGVILGVVYSLTADTFIEFDEEKEVLTLTFETVPAALIDDIEGMTTDLSWVNDLGDPIIDNSLVVAGQSVSAGGQDGVVTLVPLVDAFLRGDVNSDGVVLGLIDALALLQWVFAGGSAPACLDAADADDSGNVSALLDGSFLFEYAFTQGDAPPDPGPSVCGQDPTDDGVDCAEPQACL